MPFLSIVVIWKWDLYKERYNHNSDMGKEDNNGNKY